jgi:hypothetical protein
MKGCIVSLCRIRRCQSLRFEIFKSSRVHDHAVPSSTSKRKNQAFSIEDEMWLLVPAVRFRGWRTVCGTMAAGWRLARISCACHASLHQFVRRMPFGSRYTQLACRAPCVWVWGVWFAFALRCIALLCGVFVRLHLALFPAGQPFLPSLCPSVNMFTERDGRKGHQGLTVSNQE